MALGITKTKSLTIWELPLVGYGDDTWKDNTWIAEHLHQLANKIEKENPKIYSIGIKYVSQYKSPTLVVELFENEEKS